MGYNLAWVGFPGVSKAQALVLTGLRDTGVPSPEMDAPFQAASLPDGWSIVVSFELIFGASFEEISRNHAMLMCFVGDTADVYVAAFMLRGESVWAVSYDSSTDPRLLVAGTPPAELAAVRARIDAGRGRFRQSESEIPVELARAICGFRHDEYTGLGFTVASPV